MKILEVNNLVKKYDKKIAVNNISFSVDENSFFAFLGPNGAGKSTTINIISTLLSCDKGDITVAGFKLNKDDDSIRKSIGVVFQNSMLDSILTVKENLEVRGSFYGLSKNEVDIRVLEINKLLEVQSFYNQKYGELSGGQKRKADIARALLNWPKILILDEPTTGLDPKSRKDIWELINKLREEKKITIFLTTHYMQEVHDATNVVVINKGEIVATGSSEELRKKYSRDYLKVPFSNVLLDLLTKDSREFKVSDNIIFIYLENSFQGIELIHLYRNFISDFEIIKGSMDDVFLNLTGNSLEE